MMSTDCRNCRWFFAYIIIQIISTFIILTVTFFYINKNNKNDTTDDVIYDKENNSTYMLMGTTRSWKLAEARCISIDAHLVSILSSDENELINRIVSVKNTTICLLWLGLHNNNQQPQEYIWSDNRSLIYTNWANDTLSVTNENNRCVLMVSSCHFLQHHYGVRSNGEWFAHRCQLDDSDPAPYIICKTTRKM